MNENIKEMYTEDNTTLNILVEEWLNENLKNLYCKNENIKVECNYR